MSVYGFGGGGLGTCFTISYPIGSYTITPRTTTFHLPLYLVLRTRFNLYVANHSCLLGRTCALRSRQDPFTREARYDVYRERYEDRTFLVVSGDRAADAVWFGGVDLGKHRRINSC